jgi:thiol-disulfide isomerase/thioredoxin
MRSSIIVSALCLSAAVATLSAQTSESPASSARPARETPPDQKAYTEASRTSDPKKKLDALEKLKTDFPTSSMKASADSAILSTLVKSFPKQTDRIAKQAKMMYKTAGESQKGSVANQIAGVYLDNDFQLKDAQHYAEKGVDSMVEAKYMQEQHESFAKRKVLPPSNDDLAARFRDTRASRLATLGRIEVKRGQVDKGKKLLEEAYAVNSNLIAAGATLGELAAKAGKDSKALEYLIPARLSGRAPESANAALLAVYRKQHNGSLDGLDAMLDTEYRNRFPNPLTPDSFQPTEKRSDRLVLGEVFTGSGCPPCVAADLAFDAAMDRYSRQELVVVMYHEHVPRPDPMTNPDTIARDKAYAVTGVPTYAIDGTKLNGGGGGRDGAKTVFARIEPAIEKDLERPADAKIKAQAAVSGNTVKVTASVSDVKDNSKDLKVEILLLEKQVRYTGENGIRFHPMVVRAIESAPLGSSYEKTFDLDKVSAGLKQHLDEYEAGGHRGESFKFIEKKYQIDRTNLAVAVFVQDDKSHQVLQTAFVDLGSGAGDGRVPTETKSR